MGNSTLLDVNGLFLTKERKVQSFTCDLLYVIDLYHMPIRIEHVERHNEITKDLLLHMWIPHVLILAHLSVSHFTMSTGHLNGLNSKWMFFFHTSWSLGICFFTSNSAFITSDMSFLHVNYRHSCHWMFSHADDTWSQVRFPSSRVDSTSLHNFSCSWIISHGTGHFHKWLALLIYPSFIYKRIFLQE